MKISDLFNQTTKAACGALNGALTLKENVESKIEDISKFLSDSDDVVEYISMVVNDIQNSSLSQIVQLSKVDFNSCMNDNSISVDLKVSDNNSVSLTGYEVLKAFEDQLTNLKIQNEFLNYCCDGKESVSASDFIIRVNNNIGYVAPNASKLYLKCIEVASSPIDALKHFFGCTSMVSVSRDENNFIQIVDLSEYGGSSWSVAFIEILNDVTGFFENCWEGIMKMEVFFQNVLSSLEKVGRWLFQKTFSYLFTVYSKEGSFPSGYMDLPLIQVTFTSEELNTFLNDLETIYPTGFSYPWNGYGYKADVSKLNVKTIIQYLTSDEVEGVMYNSTVDVTIPSSPYSMLLRIGRSDSTHYIVCLYACFTIEETVVLSDADIEYQIWRSLKDCCREVSNVAPMIPMQQNVDDESVKFEEMTDLILTYSDSFSGDLASDLNDHLVGISYSDLVIPANYDDSYVEAHQIIYGLICYAGIMARKYIGDINLSEYVIPDNSINDNLTTIEDFDVTEWNVNTYRPYFKSNPVPCSVHYQTTAEQAEEVKYTISNVLIAATIALVSVKVSKSMKRLRIKSELLQAEVNRLASLASADPSSGNIDLYVKARDKNNRLRKFQRLIGNLPKSDVIEADDMTNLVEGITPAQDTVSKLDQILRLIKRF